MYSAERSCLHSATQNPSYCIDRSEELAQVYFSACEDAASTMLVEEGATLEVTHIVKYCLAMLVIVSMIFYFFTPKKDSHKNEGLMTKLFVNEANENS